VIAAVIATVIAAVIAAVVTSFALVLFWRPCIVTAVMF
jgi:hypothetical protein